MNNICVIGGGNIGTYLAVTAKRKNNFVSLLVGDKSKFDSTLSINDTDSQKYYSEKIDLITSDYSEALANIDIIMITYPSFMFSELNERMLPFIRPGIKLLFIPGTGGCEFQFADCISKGALLYGLQRVPGVFRLEEYGKRVKFSGKREKLYLGALNSSFEDATDFNQFICDFFEMPCDLLPNYLCITLTPSNPILHTTRLYSMFKDYDSSIKYERNFLFYEEWNNESSRCLIECDSELQNLCREIEKYGLKLDSVKSLKDHYESYDETSMTNKITSISSFKGLGSPMKLDGDGWVPDFTSRYFSADFPYGLKILIDIANCFCVPVKKMQEVWDWYSLKMVKNSECFELKISKEKFLGFYKSI